MANLNSCHAPDHWVNSSIFLGRVYMFVCLKKKIELPLYFSIPWCTIVYPGILDYSTFVLLLYSGDVISSKVQQPKASLCTHLRAVFHLFLFSFLSAEGWLMRMIYGRVQFSNFSRTHFFQPSNFSRQAWKNSHSLSEGLIMAYLMGSPINC